MANIINKNPMILDTQNVEVSGADLQIVSIIVKPSNATWAFALKDKNGNIVFDANQIGGPVNFTPSIPFPVSGLATGAITAATAAVYLLP